MIKLLGKVAFWGTLAVATGLVGIPVMMHLAGEDYELE